MRIRLTLDERTEAGRRGLALVAVREQIGVAIRDEVPAQVVAALRARERTLSADVISALAASGTLLGAVAGRVQCTNTNQGGSDATVSALR